MAQEEENNKQDEPEIVTFGCRLNTYESEVMRAHAKKAGLKKAIIFNTCSVTKEAERQARQAIRKARRENPEAEIIVTGCAAQLDPEMFASMEEVDRVIGNDLKLEASSWAKGRESEGQKKEKILLHDMMTIRETASHLVEGYEGRSRAFIQVQNGCDNRCTFCIIPFARGPSRSVPMGAIVDQVKKLMEAGYNELVVTGVDVTSYGPDLPGAPTFGQMLRRLFSMVPELPRLRLSSIDPVGIDDDLWDLIAHEPRLMPHLHLSVQAGDDMILKRMKRRHLRQDVIDLCAQARHLRPDIVFGADIITGFPTEDDAMFENTLDLVEQCNLTFLHVFPYSERPGTPAARMPEIPSPVRKERAARLRALGDKLYRQNMTSFIGKDVDVIVEKSGLGRSEHFMEVRFDKEAEPGQRLKVKIDTAQGRFLLGKAY